MRYSLNRISVFWFLCRSDQKFWVVLIRGWSAWNFPKFYVAETQPQSFCFKKVEVRGSRSLFLLCVSSIYFRIQIQQFFSKMLSNWLLCPWNLNKRKADNNRNANRMRKQ